MSLLVPLGLLGLIGIVALIIIYILKPNYQNKFIPSTFIWKLSLKYKKKKLPVSKLRNILLFLCQLIIITVATLILSRAIIDNSANIQNGDTIIVLDTSASMHSSLNGQTRFVRATNKALEDANKALEDGNRVSVILAGEKASFLVRQLGEESSQQLFEAFETLTKTPESVYTYGEPDVSGAMVLAEQITSFTDKASVTLYTDTTYYETDKVNVYNVNDVSEWNAAILDVRAILTENNYRIEIDVVSYGRDENINVSVEISNFNDSGAPAQPIPLVASCIGDNITTLVLAKPLDTMSEEEKDLITEELQLFAYDQIFVTIDADDSLSYDNQFYLYGGQKPTLKILYYSTMPNNYFTAALLIAQNALSDRWNIELTEIQKGDPVIEGYDLYIYEHTMPKTMPSDGVVFCVNPTNALPTSTGIKLGGAAQSSSGEMFLEPAESHPIMNNIDASAISVTRITMINSYDDYIPLMTLQEYPLLLVKDEPHTKMVVMPFSLHYSNLAVLPEFPLIIRNMLNHFFPSTIKGNVFEIGDILDLNARGETLEVAGPGVDTTLTELPAKLKASTPGTYTFKQYPISGDPAIENIYVKIPASESNINSSETVLVNPYFFVDDGSANIDLLFYLALTMVALLFIEWWLKSREQI